MATIADAFRGMISAEDLATLNHAFAEQRAQEEVDTIAAAGAISLSSYLTLIALDGTKLYTLADGVRPGQRKAIRIISVANTPAATITPANFDDGTSLTGNAVGHEAELIWTGAAWRLVRKSGLTLV